MRFGDHIRQIRLAASRSQESVAAAAGVSQNYISLVEQRKELPTPPTARAICRALGISQPWPARAYIEAVAVKDAAAKGVTFKQAYADVLTELRQVLSESPA